MTGEQALKNFAEKSFQKTITKINHRIYHFLGWGHSNAAAIIGDSSVILVDTLDSDIRAMNLKEELKKITDKPVKTIIYTHGHPDHRGGAGAFKDTVEEIIAFAPQRSVLRHYDRLNDILNKRGAFQHGYGLTDEEAICQGIGIREGSQVKEGSYNFLPPTTIYDQNEVERVIDGVKVKLYSAVGETDDQLCVWLEDDQVICCGDNYYGCWPNLYAIRGSQYRDIAAWITALDHILTFPAEALLPGHTKPLLGRSEIQEVISNFRDALESVLFQTLDCMNKGMTMNEAAKAVALSPRLQEKEYLSEFYGTIEWSVKGIYCGYLGWFDGSAAHLLPHSDEKLAATLLELIGSTDVVLDKINSCLDNQDSQMALQLIDLCFGSQATPKLLELKKKALLERATQMTSANARHYLIASAKEITVL